MSHLPLVLSFQEKAAARVAPCGLRITLAQLSFANRCVCVCVCVCVLYQYIAVYALH